MPPAAVALVGATLAASAAYSSGIVLFGTVLVEAGFGAAALSFAAVAAVGFATMAMAPKPPKSEAPTIQDVAIDRTRMIRQPITARRLAYGWVRLSGPQTFLHTTSNNQLLHIVLTLSTHRFAGRNWTLLLQDEVVPLDGNGDATGKYVGYVSAWLGLGTTAGDATFHSELTAAVTSTMWGTTHLQTECAKLYIQLKWNADLFKGGSLPNISIITEAKDDIADPRDASTGWTNNAALCIADWLKSTFGYGWPTADIASDALIAAANVCDEIQARNPGFTFTAAAGTDLLTAAIDMPTGTAIFATTTGTLPGGMATTTPYYWIRVSTTTGKIATSKANALAGTSIDITDSGTGVHTLRGVITYTVDASTNIVTLADTSQHMRTGTRVEVLTGGTLPAPLVVSTSYYWRSITATTGQLATSLANSRTATAIDITTAGTGTQLIFATGEPRYTLDGTIDTSQDAESTLRKLLSAMAGMRVTSGKTITLYAGAWRAPTVTISEDDLAEGINIQTRQSRRDLFNSVKGVFSNPDDLWQPTDFPAIQVASYVTEDQGDELWREAELSFTNSPTMAQRIARIDLERNRRQISGSWPCKLTAMRILGVDVINVDHRRFGWASKTFEVGTWKLVIRAGEGGVPGIGCDIQLKEIDANVYAWTPGTDEALLRPAQTTTLPDPFTVAAPTSLVLTSGATELFLRDDGTVFSRIKATWTAPADAFVTSGGYIEMQWKKSAASAWETGPSVAGATTTNWILDVEDGVNYDVRIRSVNALGVASGYLPETNHTVVGKTAPPEDITTFTAQQNGVTVVFKWSQVSDVDLAGYEIRFMKAPFVWADALVLTSVTRGTQVTSAAVPPSPTDPDTGAQVAWVFGIKARDTSSNYSTNALTFSTVVSNAFDIITKADQHPLWLGIKGYNIDGMAPLSLGASFDVAGKIGGAAFKPDGTKLYITDQTFAVAYQYNLALPWRMSTRSYESITIATGSANSPTAIALSEDGTRLYLTRLSFSANSPGAIYQSTVNSAWNLASASYDNIMFVVHSGSLMDVKWKPDGSRFFTVEQAVNRAVRQYSVSSAWNLTSASYDNVSISVNSGGGFHPNANPVALAFRRDGRAFYVGATTSGAILEYRTQAAWDIRSAFQTGLFSVVSQAAPPFSTTIEAIDFSRDEGEYFYAFISNNVGRQFNALSFVRNPGTGHLNPVSLQPSSGNNFDVFNDYVFNPVSNAVYEAAETNLGLDLHPRVWGDIAAAIGPSVSGAAASNLEVDYRSSSGQYDGMEQWAVGQVNSAQYFDTRIVSDGMSSGTNLTVLKGFTLVVDAEERSERDENVTVNSGGTTVAFTKPFALLPGIHLFSAQNSAAIPGLGTVTNSGFNVKVFNTSGADIGGVVNWEAMGV